MTTPFPEVPAVSGRRTAELLHQPGHRGPRRAVSHEPAIRRDGPSLSVDPAPDGETFEEPRVAEVRKVILIIAKLGLVVGLVDVHLRDVDGQPGLGAQVLD